jgi:hypothetical protein
VFLFTESALNDFSCIRLLLILLRQISYANYLRAYRQTWFGLLILDQLNPKQFLSRAEHYFELSEAETNSQPVRANLQA